LEPKKAILLYTDKEVFHIFKGLPLLRSQDHLIQLLPDIGQAQP